MVEDAVDFGVSLNMTSNKFRKSVIDKALNFNKQTLLHIYIYQQFLNHYQHYFLNITEDGINDPIELQFLEEQFSLYGVKINFIKIQYDEFEEPITTNRQVIEWYTSNKGKFTALANKLCDEVFFIIFSNRQLLQTFNLTLSENFNSLKIPKRQLTNNGKIPRINIPLWVKKSVFHRDKGKCSFCNKDLTNAINPFSKSQYDHIIPLDLFGVNDPTNIQLLCSSCNLNKKNKNYQVGTKYFQWFN